MKRVIDLIASLFVLIILLPFLIVLGLLIKITSKGNVFYAQERIGLHFKPFKLFKFRTMYIDADKKGLLTVGDKDSRITSIGYFLRKYKLDELPQLINILKGDMSIVGPRPEVKKYVDLYDDEQKKVLAVKPGLTDYASIDFINENEILAKRDDPEKAYIEEIMPQKLMLNRKYIDQQSILTDFKIIGLTILGIFKK